MSSDLVEMNVQPYKISEDFEDMNSSDNVPVDFSVYVIVQLDQSKVVDLYSNFGLKWYQNNVEAPFRTTVRNLCKEHQMIDLTTNAEVSINIASKLKTEIEKIIKLENIPVIIKTVEVGKINPPELVLEERTNTAVQTQREQTETAKIQAEKNRRLSENARAKANLEYIREMGFTKDQYLRDKAIDIQKDIVDVVKNNENAKVLLNIGGETSAYTTH